MRVDGAGVALERDGRVAGQVSGCGEGEGFLKGEVLGVEGELIVGAARSGGAPGAGVTPTVNWPLLTETRPTVRVGMRVLDSLLAGVFCWARPMVE